MVFAIVRVYMQQLVQPGNAAEGGQVATIIPAYSGKLQACTVASSRIVV